MFSYRPPKGSCWGHAIRARDLADAQQKVEAFFAAYFEPPEPQAVADGWDFNCHLRWKVDVLPHVVWAELFLKPGNEQLQRCLFVVSLGGGSRIMFPHGITFPISPNDPASYEFLRRFSADAPFRMHPKHFQVGMLVGSKGKFAWRKPDAEISARLHDAI